MNMRASDLTLNAYIEAASFDENDLDMGTGGYCATFALALYRVCLERKLPAKLHFVCLIDGDGNEKYARNHQGDIKHLIWRHALVNVGGEFYDIYGRCKPEDAIANYCYGSEFDGGTVVTLSHKDFLTVVQNTEYSYSRKYFNRWVEKLREGFKTLTLTATTTP